MCLCLYITCVYICIWLSLCVGVCVCIVLSAFLWVCLFVQESIFFFKATRYCIFDFLSHVYLHIIVWTTDFENCSHVFREICINVILALCDWHVLQQEKLKEYRPWPRVLIPKLVMHLQSVLFCPQERRVSETERKYPVRVESGRMRRSVVSRWCCGSVDEQSEVEDLRSLNLWLILRVLTDNGSTWKNKATWLKLSAVRGSVFAHTHTHTHHP